MVRYTETLDDAEFDELGALFAEGQVRIEGGPHDGATAAGARDVAALYRRIVALDAQGRTGTLHFISNLFVLVADDSATAVARSYFAVTQQTPTLALQIVACRGYRDEFRDDGVACRYASRHIVCDQVGALPHDMR